MARIDTVDSRSRLKPRREPYWVKLSTGCMLGFRKMTSASAGSWLAQYRCPDSGRRDKRCLGEFDNLPASLRYDSAKKAAEAWFSHMGRGGSNENVTVSEACEQYVKHVRAERGDEPADDLVVRFKRWVYCDPAIAKVYLTKLTRPRVEAWRRTMAATPAKINRDRRETPITRPRSASTVNRDIASLRAALNHAHDEGDVTTDIAWRVALRPAKSRMVVATPIWTSPNADVSLRALYTILPNS